MYCKKCGSKIKDSDVFCPNCGESVREEVVNNETTNSSNSGIIFGIIALFTALIPIISIPLSIVAIVKGRKNNSTGATVLGVISLICSIIVTLLVVFIAIFSFVFVSANGGAFNMAEKYLDKYGDRIEDYFDKYIDPGDDKDNKESFDLSNHEWRASDGSILLLNSDNNYAWYSDSKRDEANYSYGKYTSYNGFDAVSYMATHFSDLGFSFDKQMKSFDEDKYSIDDYYLLILECDKKIVNGDETTKEDRYAYYGFYFDGSLKLVDIKSQESINFVLINDNKSDGTL